MMRFTAVVGLFPDLPETELTPGFSVAGFARRAPNRTGFLATSTSPGSA